MFHTMINHKTATAGCLLKSIPAAIISVLNAFKILQGLGTAILTRYQMVIFFPVKFRNFFFLFTS